MSFPLDTRLAADTFAVGRLPLSRLLLMNDARYPWLILVPERPDARELFDLSATDRTALMEEISVVAAAVARTFAADKINVAALGNIVAQLHVHVIARFTQDAAWPGPVWGRLPALLYMDAAAQAMIARLRPALAAATPSFSPEADS